MENPLDMTGKVVLVTGGAKGIGHGVSTCFLQAGAQVMVCGRSQPENLPSHNKAEALFIPCDVRDVEQIDACVDEVVSRFGRLDVLVNNAGGAPFADAATASPRFSEAIIRLNLIAPLNFSQAANRVMQAQDSGGSIINIASVSTIRPSPGTAAYGAAMGQSPRVAAVVSAYPAAAQKRHAELRALLMTEAERLGVGPLTETLKWGQPSYAPLTPKIGTTLRLWRDKSGNHPALFVPCSTTLVQEFRDSHGDGLEFDGNRGLVLTNGLTGKEEVVCHFISAALTYHLRKRTS